MKKWNLLKNILFTLALTMLYALWGKEGLQELSPIHMWVILILVGLLILHLLVWLDREITKLNAERNKKRGKTK